MRHTSSGINDGGRLSVEATVGGSFVPVTQTSGNREPRGITAARRFRSTISRKTF